KKGGKKNEKKKGTRVVLGKNVCINDSRFINLNNTRFLQVMLEQKDYDEVYMQIEGKNKQPKQTISQRGKEMKKKERKKKKKKKKISSYLKVTSNQSINPSPPNPRKETKTGRIKKKAKTGLPFQLEIKKKGYEKKMK